MGAPKGDSDGVASNTQIHIRKEDLQNAGNGAPNTPRPCQTQKSLQITNSSIELTTENETSKTQEMELPEAPWPCPLLRSTPTPTPTPSPSPSPSPAPTPTSTVLYITLLYLALAD